MQMQTLQGTRNDKDRTLRNNHYLCNIKEPKTRTMDLKKKCRAVMLPTDNKSNIQLGLEGGYLYLNEKGYIDEHTSYQHIHIVAIESLVVGDKVVFNDGVWTVIQSPEHDKNSDITYLIFNNGNMIGVHKDNLMKIIATTDSSLTIPYDGTTSISKDWNGKQLPQPSTAFIEKYVKAHNAGNPITGVMVEYVEVKQSTGTIAAKFIHNLKTDSQNQITITEVKDSWSREEVIHLLKKLTNDHPLHRGIQMIDSIVDDWAEQNL